VPGLSGIVAVAGGAFSAYALRGDGTVWAWGDDDFGELGGASSQADDPRPRRVSGLSAVVALAAGESDVIALRSDGTVWALGYGGSGELGAGGCTSASPLPGDLCPEASAPVQVRGLTGIAAISAGSETGYALRGDGTVWAWGDDAFGELGDGVRRADSFSAVRVGRLGDIVAIAASSYTGYALAHDGSLFAFGDGSSGELGDGDDDGTDVPVRVAGLQHVVEVAGGGDMAYALTSDGTLWAFGAGSYGQLGDGSQSDSDVPVRVIGFGPSR
jgi:alpha-tubulin suppressor-like RCC1 family protein